MEYKELDAEAISQIRSARVRQLEEQHMLAIIDEEVATAIKDDNGIKAAKSRQSNFEAAIAAITSKSK